VDGIPEMVDDRKTGLLVPSEDVEGLAKGLIRLASDEPLRLSLAMAGHKRYWESFSRAKQVQRLGAVLKDLARRRTWR
jgi:glycosyltransferase involved in cell wall biosynthesis